MWLDSLLGSSRRRDYHVAPLSRPVCHQAVVVVLDHKFPLNEVEKWTGQAAATGLKDCIELRVRRVRAGQEVQPPRRAARPIGAARAFEILLPNNDHRIA